MSGYHPRHFRSHVERCLQNCWEVCCIEPDVDGDYVFNRGTAACFVRIDDDCEVVRVVGIAAHGVRRSMAVLREINDVNVRTSTAHALWTNGRVIVAQSMVADACTPEALGQACDAVATVANDIGDMIARVHGGSTLVSGVSEVTDTAE